MGLPQTPDHPSGQTTTAPTSSSKPTSIDQLPPEALALATKLFDHARTGATAPLSQYITAGIPVNLTNHKGDTLLMLAAYHGHLETTTMLLDAGADANVLNDRGQSVLAGAVFKGYADVVRVLVERGADGGLGQPSAVEAARMFGRGDLLGLLGVEE